MFSDLPGEFSPRACDTSESNDPDDEKTSDLPDSEQKIRSTNLDEFFNKCLKDDPYQTLHAESEEKDAEHINICLKEERGYLP